MFSRLHNNIQLTHEGQQLRKLYRVRYARISSGLCLPSITQYRIVKSVAGRHSPCYRRVSMSTASWCIRYPLKGSIKALL